MDQGRRRPPGRHRSGVPTLERPRTPAAVGRRPRTEAPSDAGAGRGRTEGSGRAGQPAPGPGRTGAAPSPAAGGTDDGVAAARRKRRRPSGRSTPVFMGLLGVVVTLNLVGLVMVLSASSYTSQGEYGSPWFYLQRQAMWSGLGAFVLLAVLRVDYRRWRRFAGLGAVVTLGLLLLVLVPGIGVGANGATRWIGWGPLTIQPSELAKLGILLFSADLLARRIHRIHDTRTTLRPVLVVTGVAAALIMAQPNLGTTLVLGAIVLSLLFVAGSPLGRLAALAGVGVVAATLAALAAPYRRARVFAFLDPWADPLNTGYQTIQAWAAIAEGGISGVGVGAGRAKWGFLPFAHTDFIFAVIAEELGLVGAVAVLALFVTLAVLGVRTALRAPDAFGTLLASGVTGWFVMQAFVNIGAVVGVLPITGVPLPFVSAGGSSLLASMAAAGILLNVARQTR